MTELGRIFARKTVQSTEKAKDCALSYERAAKTPSPSTLYDWLPVSWVYQNRKWTSASQSVLDRRGFLSARSRCQRGNYMSWGKVVATEHLSVSWAKGRTLPALLSRSLLWRSRTRTVSRRHQQDCLGKPLPLCFSTYLLLCFSASLHLWSSTSLLPCFSAFLIPYFSASRLPCYPAPMIFWFSASLLFYFSTFLLSCISAFLLPWFLASMIT